MENINSVITNQTIGLLVFTMAALLILPVIFIVIWRKQHGKKVSFKSLIIGAIGFIVSARVLELLVHMVCIVMENPISRFINGHTVAYVIYGALMAGVFEECGRYIIMKLFMKKNLTKENAIMYGIGHGGIEVWVITLAVVAMYFSIALSVKTMGVDATMTAMGVDENSLAQALPSFVAATNFGFSGAFFNIFERIVCMFLHISLTVIVYYAVKSGQKKYLFYAVAAHMLVDLFPAMYQRGVVNIIVCEIWATVWTVAFTVWAYKLYQKDKQIEE